MARTETLTVLFTDLVGSAELADNLGHTAYEAVRTAHFDALRAAVASHNGAEVKTTGDGLMVCFTSVGDAVSCAVAMQQAADRQSRRGSPTPVQIRIGVSVGEVTRERTDLFGPPVVEAARLCAAAQPGQILAADVVRVLSRGLRHTLEAVGPLTLKGLAAPVVACAVAWGPVDDATAIPLPPLLATGQQFAFAGRQPELGALLDLWKQAQAGTRRVALIAGEPGIGKTRLAAEIARAAHAGGAMALYGRCDDEVGVPFQPFVEALRYYVEQSVLPARVATSRPGGGSARRPLLGRHAGDLVRLLPELAELVPNLPPPLQSDAETERYRLFEAVAAWLGAMTERPLVLILDDLHWAAKPTLLLLKHLLRSGSAAGGAGGSPGQLLILGTYRDTELDRTHPLSDVLADLRKDPTVHRVALRGLDLAGVEAFIAGAAGHTLDEPGRALARAVHAETEGNPFFAGEILRHLAESNAMVQRDGRWVSDGTIEQLGIPEGVKEVIGRRLNRLSATANQALSMAAVIGRDFDLGVLGAVSQLDDDALVDALDEAVRARLVNEAGVVDTYRFAHALVQETLYAEIGPSKRVRRHRRIGDAIATRRPDDVTALAHHYQQAAVSGDVEKAVEYSTRAGDQARARLAFDQAEVFYGQALALLADSEATNEIAAPRGATSPGVDSSQPRHPAAPRGHAGGRGVAVAAGPSVGSSGAVTMGSASQRCELLIRFGEAQRNAGNAAFRQTLLDAARLAQRVGDTTRLVQAALASTRGFPSGVADHERIAILNAALDALGRGDTPVRAQLLATLVNEVRYIPDHHHARVLADEALALARRMGEPCALAHVLRMYINAFLRTPETLDERVACASELVAITDQLGDPAERTFAHVLLSLTLVCRGEVAEADRRLAILGGLVEEIGGGAAHRWYYMHMQASRALLAARLADAERLMTEAFAIGQASGQADAFLIYGHQLLELRRMQGRLTEVEPLVRQALTGNLYVSAVQAAVAAFYCELGHDADARVLFEPQAATGFADLPYDESWLQGMITHARVCTHLEDRPAAIVLHERLAPWHQQLRAFPVVEGPVALYLGCLATILARYDDAEAHFAEAHAMHERIGAPYWLAVTRVEWAKMQLRRNRAGDPNRARAMLDQALATAQAYGLGGVEREAAQLLPNIHM